MKARTSGKNNGGEASVDGKVTCEVNFTAMIADAPDA